MPNKTNNAANDQPPETEAGLNHARCLNCDYPLRGLATTICPECGRPFDPNDPSTFTHPSRRTSLLNKKTTLLLAISDCLVIGLTFVTVPHHPETAIWLSIPVAGALGVMLVSARGKGPLAVGGLTASIAAAGLTGWFCLSWIFDWGGTATGSSTAGLAFIFLPIGAIVFGAAAGIVGVIVAAIVRQTRWKRRSDSSDPHIR